MSASAFEPLPAFAKLPEPLGEAPTGASVLPGGVEQRYSSIFEPFQSSSHSFKGIIQVIGRYRPS